MQQLLAWLNHPTAEDGPAKAALALLWFETVHPLGVGNGRVGRPLVDLVLARDASEPSRLP